MKIYWITTATQCRHTSNHIISRHLRIWAATELEAVAIALNDQPEQTYIFWIEVYQPQICLFVIDQATFTQQLFQAWQDLAAEATGHDTEWSYLIPIDRLAQALHIAPNALLALLANLIQPELELALNGTALTFHQPPNQESSSLAIQEFYSAKVADLVRFEAAKDRPVTKSKRQSVLCSRFHADSRGQLQQLSQ